MSNPVFYISAYFEKDRSEYYSKLLAISEEDNWNAWIEYFLRGIIEQAKENIKKVKMIRELHDKLGKDIASLTRSHNSFQILDFLFHRPIFTGSNFSSQTDIAKPSAARILKLLLDKKIVYQVKPAQGRKPALYCFPELLKLIQE